VTKREQFHSNIIGQPVTLGNEFVRERLSQLTDYFMAHGVADPAAASHKALVALGNLIRRQALIMGFSDAFAVVGIVLLMAAICVALARNSKS
jgi:DHA2 family multidrug resistance protein